MFDLFDQEPLLTAWQIIVILRNFSSMSYIYVQTIGHAFHSSTPYNDVNQVSRWLSKSNILPVCLYMLYGGEVWWVAQIVCENLGGTSVMVVYRADKLLLSRMQSGL